MVKFSRNFIKYTQNINNNDKRFYHNCFTNLTKNYLVILHIIYKIHLHFNPNLENFSH